MKIIKYLISKKIKCQEKHSPGKYRKEIFLVNIPKNNQCFLMVANGVVVDKMFAVSLETHVEDLLAMMHGQKPNLGVIKLLIVDFKVNDLIYNSLYLLILRIQTNLDYLVFFYV